METGSSLSNLFHLIRFLTLFRKINRVQTNAGHDNTEHGLTTNLG